MKQNASVNSTDRFFFANTIQFHKFGNEWLVVSVETANWLVIKSLIQKEMLELLISGKSIGEIVSCIHSEVEFDDFKKLLASITARQFANTTEVPQSQFVRNEKMMNCYLTNSCNLSCEHCFMHSGVKLDNELEANEWCKLISDFKMAGGEGITFTGGEPLLKKDFSDIVKHSHSIGLTVTVLTNGILWTEGMISEMSPYLDEVQISLDGVDENNYSIVRKNGDFDKVVRNIILFANNNVRTSVSTTFTFSNLGEDVSVKYKRMVDYINSQTNKDVFFKLSKKLLRGRNVNFTDDDNSLFLKMVQEVEDCVNPDAKYKNFMEGHLPNLVADNCGYGGISVSSDGEIFYCNRISELDSYGNIRDNDLNYFMEIGDEIRRKTSVDNVTPCRDCCIKYICCGGCRIDEYNFRGRLNHFVGELSQVKCSETYKQNLMKKMIDSYNFYYRF